MKIRKAMIAKLQQLPDPLLQKVSDFIDRLMRQPDPVNGNPDRSVAKAWMLWFEAGDHLEIVSNEPNSDYQQLLLTKYRQQGLEL